MIKRMIIMLTIVGLILIGIFGFINFKARMIKQYMSAQGEPLQTVSTISQPTPQSPEPPAST